MEKLNYKFVLPELIKNGLEFFDDIVVSGTTYRKKYLELLNTNISHDAMMEFLRKGYPEECFKKYVDPLEEYKEKILDMSSNILEDQEKLKYILVHVSGNNKDLFLIYDKKDKVFYQYKIMDPIRSGLGTGNEEGYLYKFLLKQQKNLGIDLNISVYALAKNTLKKLLIKKYKYYVSDEIKLYSTTHSGSGRLTKWIDKTEKSNYKMVDKTDSIDLEVICKIIKKG